MRKQKRVLVIGAGIVGVSAAIYLQRDGHDVVLVDRQGPASETSHGNGGIMVPSGVVPVNAPGLLKSAPGMLLCADSPLFIRWPYSPKLLPWLLPYIARANARDTTRVAQALAPILHDSLGEHQAVAEGSVAEKWIQPSDYVFVYEDRAAFKKDAFGWSLRRKMGIEWDEMDSAEFEAYEPIFTGQNKFAIRLGNHGYLKDPGQYVNDLAEHMVQQGGEQRIANVEDIVHANGKVTAVKTDKGLIECDVVVLAAGVWSKSLVERLDVKIPMETERGYHIELVNPSVMPNRSALMIVAGKFVVTPMDGRLRCAGIVEFGGLGAPPGKAPVELLKTHIHALLPTLKYDRIDEWMGHRPAPVDSIPFIGPIDKIQGVYAAFGHHHVGITGGPRTGRLLADIIAGRETQLDITPYRLDRFTH